MRVVLPFFLESLKKQVLERAGIKTIMAGDCKHLSERIMSGVNQRLSETTLKRIFGFASTAFAPSDFTLNALSVYCGYTGWEAFCEQQEPGLSVKRITDDQLSPLFILGRKISRKTLESLTGSTGIPRQLTVKRDFMEEHLDMFCRGDQPATVFTAPSGYGKTTGLCHWVTDQLDRLLTECSNDIILFLSSRLLPGTQSGGNINDWLSSIIGFSPENKGLIQDIEDTLSRGGHFYLVIDGFDQEKFKPRDFELLTELLLEVISSYHDQPGFKLILTMRSANWLNLYHRLIAENKLDQWYLGFMQHGGIETNMLPLSSSEIQLVFKQIRPEAGLQQISAEVASLFSYPLFLQYYYQKRHTVLNLTRLDHFGIYEVISSYFLDKIYRARFATEKIMLINLFLDNGQLEDGMFAVKKLRVYEGLKKFAEAYHDLLSLGFVREINRSRESKFAEYIEFADKELFSYSLSRKMVQENNEQYNDKLAEGLCRIKDKECRLAVFKWSVFNAVKVGQFLFFEDIQRLPWNLAEKAALLKFLVNMMGYTALSTNSPVQPITGLRELDYYLGAEFLSPDYTEVLEGLLRLNLDDESKVWVHTSMAMIYIIQLNSARTVQYIRNLKEIPLAAYLQYPMSPLHCIETIYYYLKHGKVTTTALKEITRFCFNPHGNDPRLPASIISLLYLLALNTLLIADNERKALRFIKIIEHISINNDRFNGSYPFFVKLAKADLLLSKGMTGEGKQIYTVLDDDFKQNRSEYTAYMKACLSQLKAKVLICTGSEEESRSAMDELFPITGSLKFHYQEVVIISSYLSLKAASTSSDYWKQLHYRLIKLTRTGGFEPQYFIASGKAQALTKLGTV